MRTPLWLVVAVMAACPLVSGAAETSLPSFRDAVERAQRSTVRIVTSASADEGADPSAMQDAIRRFGFDLGDGSHVLGTGVLISAGGEVVTSRHVVDQVTRLRVRLANDEERPATVVSTDVGSDLALIRIDPPESLVPLDLEGAAAVNVGEWVVVLGNGAGPLPAAVAGIVGAKGRLLGVGAGADFLQMGLTLLPMASGGPIIDPSGRLVGIAMTAADPTDGVSGIAFGAPVELVRWFVGQVRERGRVVRGWLGLTVQPVTMELAGALRLSAADGALVADVASGSPAARAGLRRGDVVTRIGEQPVRRARELPGLVAGLEPGTTVTVVALRNGHERPFDVGVREEPVMTVRAPTLPSRGVEGAWGLTVRPATAQEIKRWGLTTKMAVAVRSIDEGSAAEEGGIEAGDVILAANRESIVTIAGLRKALRAGGDHALLQVRRGTAVLFVELDR